MSTVTFPLFVTMLQIVDLSAFVAVVDTGSLTAAARQLGRSLQAVSRSLMSLEKELGVVLVQRTTRSSRATEAGLAFLARIRPALADIALAHTEASARATRVFGRVRLAGPPLFGAAYLTPLVATFMVRHPEVEAELMLGQDYADLVGESLDLACRFGDLPDSRLKARRLGSLRQVVFGAPRYLAQAGWPRVPADLAGHRCIVRTSALDATTWTFRRDGRVHAVSVGGRFGSDSPAACNAAAVQGLGLARAPLWQVRDDIDAGRLALVLDDYQLPAMPVHLVWAPAPLPARVRLLIDHIACHLDLSRI